MMKTIRTAVVIAVAGFGVSAWASAPAAKVKAEPRADEVSRRVKLSPEKLDGITAGAADFHQCNGCWKDHDRGGGNNPPNHKRGNK